MNRREFLQGVAAIAAAAALPKIEATAQPSGFDKFIASYPPQRAMTYADLEKGVEMLRKGWPDPFEMNKLYVFDPPLEIGHRSYAVRDNFGISASRIQAAIERHMQEDDLA